MRLLSLLHTVEQTWATLAEDRPLAPVSRRANYERSRARLTAADGRQLRLQGFSLADGQACLKASCHDVNGVLVAEQAFYVKEDAMSWTQAAMRLAEFWLDAPEAAPASAGSGPVVAAEPLTMLARAAG